jgi:uncharacterized protein with GYD domain
MAKYLLKVSYNAEGLAGVLRDGGSARVAAVERTAASVGGSIESFYFAFGGADVYVVVDLPDHSAAVALAGAVVTSGRIGRYETVVLLTPEQVDAARDVRVDYTPPGG